MITSDVSVDVKSRQEIAGRTVPFAGGLTYIFIPYLLLTA
jgi:hypothetical protein